jgi:hypothetical protein
MVEINGIGRGESLFGGSSERQVGRESLFLEPSHKVYSGSSSNGHIKERTAFQYLTLIMVIHFIRSLKLNL